MSWQEPIVALIVIAAAVYVVWKLGFAGSRQKKPSKKPDVPISRLRRAPRASDRKRG